MASRWIAGIKEFLWPSTAPDRAVPAMDGAFAPNDQLDDITRAIEIPDPQDVVHHCGEVVLVATGTRVESVDIGSGQRRVIAELAGTVTGLHASDDHVLACVDGWGLARVELHDGSVQQLCGQDGGPGAHLAGVVQVADRTFVTSYAASGSWADWPRDLMTKGTSGALLEVLPDGTLKPLVERLEWAYGLDFLPGIGLVFTESWRHRLRSYDLDSGRTGVLRDRLPGYPARVHPGSDGHVLLAMFAARTQLIEFVLREDNYRTRMMNEIPMEDWVTPAFRKTGSVRAPFQLGGAVHLGEVKPWAPSRSYGLAAVLDAGGDVLVSAHSRAGGERHGVTAICQVGERVVIACYGTSELLIGTIDHESEVIQ